MRTYRPTAAIIASGYRSPAATPLGATSSIRRRSSVVRVTSRAPTFSSRYCRLGVTGKLSLPHRRGVDGARREGKDRCDWGKRPADWGKGPPGWGKRRFRWGDGPAGWGIRRLHWGDGARGWGKRPCKWGNAPANGGNAQRVGGNVQPIGGAAALAAWRRAQGLRLRVFSAPLMQCGASQDVDYTRVAGWTLLRRPACLRGFSRPVRPHGDLGLLTQGIGLRPRPWAMFSRPAGPVCQRL